MSVSHTSDNARRWQNLRKFPVKSWGLVALMLLTVVGCGENWASVQPTSGTVKFNGKAPSGARVLLHAVKPPEDGSLAVTPSGRVEDDGSFKITSYQAGDGAAPGEYVVTVEWYPVDKDGSVGANAIPKEYSNPTTSPLKATVSDGGPTTLDPIDIKGQAADAKAAGRARTIR
jgi:hypothetical protein